MLMAYHIAHFFLNIAEIITIQADHHLPILTNCLSIGDCYGLATFIYAHVIIFNELMPCVTEEDKQPMQGWLIFEVSFFYFDFLISIIMLSMLCARKGSKSKARIVDEE